LSFTVLGSSRKLDASQYTTDAAKDKTRASKQICKSEELDAIKSLDGEIRAWIKGRTIPSGVRKGLDALRIKAVPDVEVYLGEMAARRKNLVEVFAAKYVSLKWRDKLPASEGGLGSLYSDRDYVPEGEVCGSFEMSWNYLEFSAPGSLKTISSELFERADQECQAIFKNAIEEGKALIRGEFLGIVEHLRERLAPEPDGTKKKFKKTLVSNAIEFLQTFSSRNYGDAELESLVKQTADMLSGVTPEDLRNSDTVRARVQAGAESIKGQLDSLLTDAGQRKIDFSDDTWGDI
jgi:hypothetical protein